MAKTRQNFEIYKGEQKTLQVQIADDDGDAVDVSACTILYRVAKTNKSAAPIIQKTSDDDITVTGDDNDTVSIPFVHADTADEADGSYYHELRISNDEADLVVMTGSFTLDSSITYPPPD